MRPATNPTLSNFKATELRDKILSVALNLLAEPVQKDILMDDIMEHSRVDADTFTSIFPDDRTLWSALLSRVHRRLMSLLEHAAIKGTHSIDTLEQMFHSHVFFIAKNPAIPRLLFHFSETDDPQLRAQVSRIMEDYEAGLSLLLAQAKVEGHIGVEVDTRTAAMLFIAMIQGLVFRALMTGNTKSLESGAQRVLSIYMQGIRTRVAQCCGHDERNTNPEDWF